MKIATVTADRRGLVDDVLAEVAGRLAGERVRLAGVVRAPATGPLAHRCDMDLAVLSTDRAIRITQDLGAHSASCRLDAGALEDAVAAVEASLQGPVDLLILNKFGQREADGHGFRAVIGAALARDIPVLLGLPLAQRAAFDRFAAGLAEALPPDATSILDWCRRSLAAAPA
ncbi:MAG: DUF2478 domain-containing protein [Alphaproteobacteria bacterium]|nr:DUF2478 domain-containing protein [Alphaproteobacteria bacterium]